MNFKASLDTPAKIITALITFIFLGIILMQTYLLIEKGFKLVQVLTILFLLVVYIGLYGNRILGYTLTSDHLVIRKAFAYKNINIAKSNITSANRIPEEAIIGASMRMGVGGVFGYHGRFSNSKIGAMTLMLTQKNHLVLIQTNSRDNIIVSPDDIDKFLNQLSNSISKIE